MHTKTFSRQHDIGPLYPFHCDSVHLARDIRPREPRPRANPRSCRLWAAAGEENYSRAANAGRTAGILGRFETFDLTATLRGFEQ